MWSGDDIGWMHVNYPALRVDMNGDIVGKLVFRMLYEKGLVYINPSPEHLSGADGVYIADQYSIRISRKEGEIPVVYETGNRIKAVANRRNISLMDVHMYPSDESLCLANALEIRRSIRAGMSLGVYIDDFLIPYLFAQHFFERYETWPWGELLHGPWGLIGWLGLRDDIGLSDIVETLAEISAIIGVNDMTSLFNVRLRWYGECICGSGKRYGDCHPEVVAGVRAVRMARASGKLNMFSWI